ncbi:MAG: hypothetical protein FJZ63_05085 [Chlamydiae bacterium]|nr:hypothetical protein [Chlamydiota bacterium]
MPSHHEYKAASDIAYIDACANALEYYIEELIVAEYIQNIKHYDALSYEDWRKKDGWRTLVEQALNIFPEQHDREKALRLIYIFDRRFPKQKDIKASL